MNDYGLDEYTKSILNYIRVAYGPGTTAVATGMMTPDEARAREGLPPARLVLRVRALTAEEMGS